MTSTGARLTRRAVRYDLSQLQTSVSEIVARRGEIGVHGIDAWRDTAEARKEREQIQALTHRPGGWSTNALAFLRFRIGRANSTRRVSLTIARWATTRPLVIVPAQRRPSNRLEQSACSNCLCTSWIQPSSIPVHLHFSPKQAMTRINDMVDDMRQFGGVLMVNWHDRSIAPERLWDDFYAELVENLESAGAWFCTASEAAQWFRRRREVRFGTSGSEATLASTKGEAGLPGLRIRSYQGEQRSQLWRRKIAPLIPPSLKFSSTMQRKLRRHLMMWQVREKRVHSY